MHRTNSFTFEPQSHVILHMEGTNDMVSSTDRVFDLRVSLTVFSWFDLSSHPASVTQLAKLTADLGTVSENFTE